MQTGSTESRYAIYGGELNSLSQQELESEYTYKARWCM